MGLYLIPIKTFYQISKFFVCFLPFLVNFLLKPAQADYLYINDDFIRQNYMSKIHKNERIQITFDSHLSLIDLQNIFQNDTIRYAKSIELSGLKTLFNQDKNSSLESLNLMQLFYPRDVYGQKNQLENLISSGKLNFTRFNLKVLNMSANSLSDDFFNGYSLNTIINSHSTLLDFVIKRYFSHLSVLKLSQNKLKYLKRDYFGIFSGKSDISSNLEVILLDQNLISSIQHDSFYDLKSLKYLDLSSNKLKIIHPMTFSYPYFESKLFYLNLKSNNLKAVFNGMNGTLQSLAHLYIDQNDDLKCDCGLDWIWRRKSEINIDFECTVESLCKSEDPSPNLITENTNLEESSEIPIIRSASKRWFAWTVFVDHLPSLIPFPYLISNETKTNLDLIEELENQEKHNYHAWLFHDTVLKCSNRNETNLDESNSTIIWKTQYGYFSYMESFDTIDEETNLSNLTNYNSFKIFYKLNKLTRIYKNRTIRISDKFSAVSHSLIYVTPENYLVITNMRQLVSGPFICLSINENGIKTYEYNIHVRTGVSEYFIYSLFVSIISMIVPSIIGLIICCICEYQADKNYPMTPPCYPTPMASTPPNFDFNEWMANAASYFPNLNIHETLEQVSKRLRKGMEKASVTVKSLGMTSSAYIYSMYEQSSQRLYDLRQYVPNINVPTINLSLNLPTMRYPPMGQLANRMRAGMGNMFLQFREFCGSSDLTHTPSIVDIQSDCSASNAVGKAYIMDQFNIKDNTRLNQSNFYRFLHLIKEESKMDKKLETNMDGVTEYSVVADDDDEPKNNVVDESKPCTSGLSYNKNYSNTVEVQTLSEDSEEEVIDMKQNDSKLTDSNFKEPKSDSMQQSN